jgi:ariadne-1
LRCEQLDAWEDKNTSDASTGQWMQAHTKRCRKCHARVEKNGGCNWIVCRCGHQFCYFCLCTEQSHHNVVCNAPPSAQVEGAKSELEYYMHYYDRWHGHCESQKLEGPLRQRAREQMEALMHCTEAPRALSEVQHLCEAVEVLVDCRRRPPLAPRHAIPTPHPRAPHQTRPRVSAAGGSSSTPTHASSR